MRTNLGQAEDRKRTYEGPHRQKVQFYQTNFSIGEEYNHAIKCVVTNSLYLMLHDMWIR